MVIREKHDRPLFIAYDVRDNRLRSKIFDACEDYGLVSVQYSVFFGFLDPVKRRELQYRITGVLAGADGQFIMIALHDRGMKNVVAEGAALGVGQASLVRFL